MRWIRPPRARLGAIPVALALAGAALAPGTARADEPRAAPIELLAGEIASAIAGRPVAVRCEDDAGWQADAVARGFDGAEVWGYVALAVDPDARVFLVEPDAAALSPRACRYLQAYAGATLKPTTCAVPVRAPAARRGRRAKAIPRSPCFVDGWPTARMPDGYWADYHRYAIAIGTLAHEAVHLGQARAGLPMPSEAELESEATCHGIQLMPQVVAGLGGTVDDGRGVARYFLDLVYPGMPPEYRAVPCVRGGSLDLTPDDGVWP